MEKINWQEIPVTVPQEKELISIRLSKKVLEYFREHNNYQGYINSVLESYVEYRNTKFGIPKYVINGKTKLKGEITISGCKNAALPAIFVALLTAEKVVLTNMPNVQDIYTAITLVEMLGVKTDVNWKKSTITLHAEKIHNTENSYDIVKKMRASFYMLGSLLGRLGKAEVAMPGGCNLGNRPVDLHLAGMQKLGAKLVEKNGVVYAQAPKGGLIGNTIELTKISDGATINLALAAVTAKGTTVIKNVSVAPNIVFILEMLNSMGAEIKGIGTREIEITGVKKLHGIEIKVMPDFLEAGSFAIAAAITKGNLTLHDAVYDDCAYLYEKLAETGVKVTKLAKDILNIDAENVTIKSVDIKTGLHPDFSTDLQPQWTTLMCLAEGKAVIEETVFNNRFSHVPELARMNANIKQLSPNKIEITGGTVLQAANVMSSNIRDGFALTIAALTTEGTKIIDRIYHIERGFENLVKKLVACGSDIQRVKY